MADLITAPIIITCARCGRLTQQSDDPDLADLALCGPCLLVMLPVAMRAINAEDRARATGHARSKAARRAARQNRRRR